MINYRDAIKKSMSNFWNVRDEYKGYQLPELRETCKRESLLFSVCALNVEGDLNVGMMLRTASLMGAEHFYIFGRRKTDDRSMVGADKYIPLTRIHGFTNTGEFDKLKFYDEFILKRNFMPVFVETDGSPLNEYHWPYNNTLLVFGNESTGIPDELSRSYPKVSIPQRGVLRSLNVATAASIVMWDLRMKKGWF